jgi:hypothetical protein
MEIRPVGAELFHTQDMKKLIVAFRNFAKAPPQKNSWTAVAAGNPSCTCHDTSTQPGYSQSHPTLIIAHL